MGRVYVAATGNTAVNSTSDITIATLSVASLVAGEQIVVDGSFILHNNADSDRTYIITVDFDGLGDVEITTTAVSNSSTTQVGVFFKALLDIRSTSLAYGQLLAVRDAAQRASGADLTMAATPVIGKGWFQTPSDATGTTDVTLKIRSNSATATQTCRLVGFLAEVPEVIADLRRPLYVRPLAVMRASGY